MRASEFKSVSEGIGENHRIVDAKLLAKLVAAHNMLESLGLLEQIKPTFALVLRAFRFRNNWEIYDLHKSSGIDKRTLRRLENGATPQHDTLKTLIKVFGPDFEKAVTDLPGPEDV